MNRLIYFIGILFIVSCSSENTDTSVVQNETPVQAKIRIDTIPPPLDTLMFNKLALDCFFHLGHSTGGEFYFKSGIESVHETIIKILENHTEVGTDLVLLIDKTGSMQNDIDSVRINLNLIIDQLERLDDTQIGVAVYGDKNVDGTNWWSETDLTTNYQIIRDYINSLKVSDGGDYPESVYDGIAKVITESTWRENAKKMILVIGDAPSLEDSLADYSRETLIQLCNREGVEANLFPVLVTPFKAESYVEYSEFAPEIINEIYPNPAKETINVNVNEDHLYLVSILNLNGIVILEEEIKGTELKLNIPSGTASGNYILRVYDKETMQMNAEKIIISQ